MNRNTITTTITTTTTTTTTTIPKIKIDFHETQALVK